MVKRRGRNESVWSAVVAAIRIRWVLAFAFAVVGALALNADQASAAQAAPLDCGIVLERECSPTEELAFCVINSYQEFEECTENGGFVHDVGCYIVYVGEFYGCFLEAGGSAFVN
jgi:hypothetical protein